MSFIADKQTLEDLNIPGRYKNNSISRIFDRTITAGGSRVIEAMFQYPLAEFKAINERSDIFKYFTTSAIEFPFNRENFESMENYLRSGASIKFFSSAMRVTSKRVLQLLAQDKDYELLERDVLHTITLLNHFDSFSAKLEVGDNPYSQELTRIRKIFKHPKLSWLTRERGVKHLSFFKLLKYDYLLKGGMYEQMIELTSLLFNLDAYTTVAVVARKFGFNFASALPKHSNKLEITGLYHPTIENAVGNSVSLHQHRNVMFLTGANMAGKSTLMKSLGVCIYLAHMGFPIAADHMEFSVKDGLYTSINVPDNLDMGYSHFYAEVLRVKKVAEEVAADKDLFVIFDELFKGTNVKDAYDAILAITEAFSENRNCFFMISTHIIEVGEDLRKKCDNFKFAYLPTVMQDHIPKYTFRLTEGITQDRQGMIIIENEGILDMLNKAF